MDNGLIKRKNKYYTVTSFGQLVYKAQAIVNKAIQNRSRLEIVDVLGGSKIPKDEFAKLVNNIIHDLELREILAKQVADSP